MLDPQSTPSHSVAPSDRGNGRLTSRQLAAVEIVVQHQLDKNWTEIARLCGVDRTTLWNWRQQPAFQVEVVKATRRFAGQHIPLAYHALIENVRKGKESSIKMLLELTGEYQRSGLRDLLGAWMQALAIAGTPAIRQLVGLAEQAQAAGASLDPSQAIEAPAEVIDHGLCEQVEEDWDV